MADANKKLVDELKAQGNEALKAENFEEAIQKYTEAIKLDPENPVLYSNRSAALTKDGKYLEAIADADDAIKLNKEWGRGYSRKGTALRFLNRFEEACEVYEEGLKVEPNNAQLLEGLEDCKANLSGPGGSQPIPNPFNVPDMMEKLQANPTTREYLKQPDYRMMLELLKNNPNALQNLQDKRVIQTLGVLLGLDLQGGSAFDNRKEESAGTTDSNTTSDPPQSSSSNSSSDKKSDASTSEQSKDQNKQNLSDSSKQALEAKEAGNAAYKKKQFTEALEHYEKAKELDPTNITFMNNKAAVYFEQGEYDKCIEECNNAVEVGRENRADYTLIAKALGRIGKAYLKKDDDNNALKYLNKSLSEHRTPETTKLIHETEKRIKEKERLEYLNPELALQEKTKGNEFFLNGKYPEAKKHYDEAIKRNPDDAKLYSNRAACYTKLMEFGLALRDADKCIDLDPKFIKGYLRKGSILIAMKDWSKASVAYQKAIDLDPGCQEAINGYKEAVMGEGNSPEAAQRRAMNNPEVQQILADPAMQLILQQMQKDPKAVREHLQNKEIAAKIEKLVECGIIAIR